MIARGRTVRADEAQPSSARAASRTEKSATKAQSRLIRANRPMQTSRTGFLPSRSEIVPGTSENRPEQIRKVPMTHCRWFEPLAPRSFAMTPKAGSKVVNPSDCNAWIIAIMAMNSRLPIGSLWVSDNLHTFRMVGPGSAPAMKPVHQYGGQSTSDGKPQELSLPADRTTRCHGRRTDLFDLRLRIKMLVLNSRENAHRCNKPVPGI